MQLPLGWLMGYAFQFLKRERREGISGLTGALCSDPTCGPSSKELSLGSSHPTRLPTPPWGAGCSPNIPWNRVKPTVSPHLAAGGFLWRFPPSAAQGVACCAARKLAWTPWGRPFGGSGWPPLTQEGWAPHGRTEGRKFTASACWVGSDGGTRNVLYPSTPNQKTLRVCVPEPVGHVVPSPSWTPQLCFLGMPKWS